MRLSRRSATFLGLALALGACAPVGDEGLWSLHRSLVRHGAAGFEAPPGALAEASEACARRFRPAPLALLPVAEEDGPRCLVLLSDDRAAAGLLAPLGVELLADGGFRVGGREQRAPGDVLAATFADPDRRGLPLTVWMGNDEAALAAHLTLVRPEWKPRLRVYIDGDLGYEAALLADGTPDPMDDAPGDRRAELELLRTTPPALEVGGLRLHSDGERVPQDFARRMAGARDSALAALGVGDAPPVEVLLFRHPSDLVRHTKSDAPWSVNPVSHRASTLFYRRFPRDGGAAAATASALAAVGPSEHAWLPEALGVQASGMWWGAGLGGWLAHLFQSDLGLPVETLLAPASDDLYSPHRLVPLRALLVRHLVEEGGPEVLRAVWNGSDPFPLVPSLEASFLDFLARNAADVPPREDRRESALPEQGLRGIALAGPPDSFLEPRLRRSLVQAASLGADALSITVQASAGRTSVPVRELPGPLQASLSDLAIAVAVREGRIRDMRSMLVLQPLAATTGTWAEANSLANPRNADRFFDEYAVLAEHYGLLAEAFGIELFCIGAELGNVSRTAPLPPGDRAANERKVRAATLVRWRELVARFRAPFKGALTYAADSVWKAEEIGFWKDLDCLGIHLFPQLRHFDGPPENLGGAFYYQLGLLGEVAREEDLPALVIQAGYPSRSDSWTDFAVPRGDVDHVVQDEVLLGMARAFRTARGQPDGERVRGVFLWSWSPDPRSVVAGDGGFSPQGKVAKRTLRALLTD